MKTINRELKDYIEQQILPIYENNDSGHGIEHIQYVVKRSLRFASQFPNINLDMVYVINRNESKELIPITNSKIYNQLYSK